ncbi:MAG: polyphosphate kinase 2 family protein [Planctomycetota bacterium]
MPKPVTFKPGDKIKLADVDPRKIDGEWDKESAAARIAVNTVRSRQLAYQLYAENQRALLLVLQGMDTAGKDGTIRVVTTGINPQSFHITSFKQPSVLELDHDFLWRIHHRVPAHGQIGIFNRSHYEDVLVVRVHNLVPEEVWRTRYQRINEFEEMITEGGVKIVKCFLHVSYEEQRERLQARLDKPHKRWKFSKGDLSERKLWPDYQAAYEDAINKCNTELAPWYIIPSDRKWYRNLVVSELLRDSLEAMSPQFPPCEEGLDDLVIE